MTEKWALAGTYVGACSCKLICPCPVDGDPTGPNGYCVGTTIFHIDKGSFGKVDLSGLNFAWKYWAPGHFTGGGIKMGIVVDESATDEQANGIDRIASGKEGGVWGQFTALTEQWLGVERGKVNYSDGDNPKGGVEGKSDITVEIIRSPDGAPTTVRQSAQHWRPEYMIGKASGHSKVFDLEFDPIYGEVADYSFVSG